MSGLPSLRWTLATVTAAALVVCSLGCFGCASSNGTSGRGATRDGGGGPPTGPSASEIIVKLNVAEEHRAAVEAILEDAEERRAELMSAMSGSARPDRNSMDNSRSEAEAIRTETEESLAEYLTEEQLEQYRALIDESRENMRSQMGGRSGGRPPGGPGEGF